MNIDILILGGLLLVFSIIDLKVRELPSILLTGTLLVFTAVNINNIPFGILSFILAYLLYEADFIGGVADIKIIATIGFLISNLYIFGIYVILLVVYGTIYKALIKWRFKKTKEVPFIPCLLCVFITLALSVL